MFFKVICSRWHQVASLYLIGPRPGPGPIRLPTSSHIGQSGGEVAGLPVQKIHSDCTSLAQHALVLGSGCHV